MNKKSNYGCLTVIIFILFLPISLPIMIAVSYAKNDKNSNQKKHYTDEELKSYGLLDCEKKEVEKGNYAPWQFAEPDEGDELDSDDYYYDDF